jgi:hypothetical protein
MRRFILPIFLTATFSAPCVAQVQPGSVGGTIGKQDKSISGGAEADRPRAAPQQKRSDTKSQQRSSGHSCNRIVGKWTWFNNGATEFDKDGSARDTLYGNSGKWTCAESEITINWITGVDHVTISHDGNSLVVHSPLNGGLVFTATRKSQD